MGSFRCFSGLLVDTSYCIGGDADVVVRPRDKLALSLSIYFSTEPSMNALRNSFALAFGVTPNLVHRVTWSWRGRRLSHGLMAPRLLKSSGNYNVDAEVIAPENVSSESLMAMATNLTANGSAVQQAWTRSLSDEFGIVAGPVEYVVPPQSFQTVLVMDSKGSILGSTQLESQAVASEESGNTALFVGVIAGMICAVLVLVMTLAGLARFGFNGPAKFEV